MWRAAFPSSPTASPSTSTVEGFVVYESRTLWAREILDRFKSTYTRAFEGTAQKS
jgi:hypothetical protein